MTSISKLIISFDEDAFEFSIKQVERFDQLASIYL